MQTPKPKSFIDFTPDQLRTAQALVDCDYKLVIAKAGSGKTAVTLTAIADILDEGSLKRILVVATKSIVAGVWEQERNEWAHLQHLTIRSAIGPPTARARAIEIPSDIVLISYDNLVWFFERYGATHDFDGIVFDEITKITPKSNVFKRSRRKLDKFVWRIGLTASPVSESWEKLYSMMLMLDNGYALGTNFQKYLSEYFQPVDYERRSWKCTDSGKRRITQAIQPALQEMEDYRDELPKIHYQTYEIDLPTPILEIYRNIIKGFCWEDGGVEAVNSGVLQTKLHQITQGFVYDGDEQFQFHTNKLKFLRWKLTGITEPVMIVYWFEEDLIRLKEAFPKATVFQASKAAEIQEAWNNKKIPYLLIHPRSAAHGLNMAKGGRIIVFYTLFWSNELYEQVIARLWRRGQTREVIVMILYVRNGLDPVIKARLDEKGKQDALLLDHIKEVMQH